MKEHQVTHPASVVRNAVSTPAKGHEERVPSCPALGCRGTLHPIPSAAHASYDSMTGLDHLVCAMCDHHGMRVPNGLHLTFRGPDEYVFHYPPSLATLTIAASPAVLALFTQHSVTQTQAAKFMAEWVLLTGRVHGIVRFADEPVALEDCYDYFRRHIVHYRCAETA